MSFYYYRPDKFKSPHSDNEDLPENILDHRITRNTNQYR
jgi:hypothetical protein